MRSSHIHSFSPQDPAVVNGDAISELGYTLGTSADNYRSYYLEAAFVQNLVGALFENLL